MSMRKRFASVGVAATLLAGAGVVFVTSEASAATYSCNYSRSNSRTYAGHYWGSTYVPKKGQWSKAAIEAQCLLKAEGWNPGPIDGIYGDKTISATMYFQAAKGLPIDGYVGPDTWPVLRYFA